MTFFEWSPTKELYITGQFIYLHGGSILCQNNGMCAASLLASARTLRLTTLALTK